MDKLANCKFVFVLAFELSTGNITGDLVESPHDINGWLLIRRRRVLEPPERGLKLHIRLEKFDVISGCCLVQRNRQETIIYEVSRKRVFLRKKSENGIIRCYGLSVKRRTSRMGNIHKSSSKSAAAPKINRDCSTLIAAHAKSEGISESEVPFAGAAVAVGLREEETLEEGWSA